MQGKFVRSPYSWYRRTSSSLRRESGQSLAEAGPVFFIVFVVMLFMLTILSLGIGFGTLALASQHSSRLAAEAPTETLARQKVNETKSILTGPFGQFGGVRNGDLVLTVEESLNGQPNFTNFTQPVDPENKVYRYKVRAVSQLQPMLWPQAIGAGFEATAIVEHPEGLGQ